MSRAAARRRQRVLAALDGLPVKVQALILGWVLAYAKAYHVKAKKGAR